MADIKRKWDLLNKDERKNMIEEIIRFFQEERDEEIGILAAEEVLDFMLEKMALPLYSKGVEDSKKMLQKRFEDFSIDLDVLMDK